MQNYTASTTPEIKAIERTNYAIVDVNVLAESKEAFHAAVTLDILSDAISKRMKKEFEIHYQVLPLEGVWHLLDKGIGFSKPENIKGMMMIKQPLELSNDLFEKVKMEVLQHNEDTNLIPYIKSARLQINEAGEVVQMLHIGPYTQEPVTFKIMDEFAIRHGRNKKGEYHREIYLKDIRHTTAEKFETILQIFQY